MAISDKVSIETRFQLNTTTPNFKITDNSDYPSEGIATSDVIGALKITNPIGSVIHETVLPASDIDVDVQDYIDTILLPLDSNGDVMSGAYTITYTIRVAGAVQPGDYSKTFIYDYCYVAPEAVIDVEVDLINAKFTSTDNTAYPTEITSSALTHTIFPPNGLDDTLFPDKVVSTATNVYTPIATKTWTAKISNIIEVTYSDGLIVDDTIVGDKERDIVDDINICNLQCNMRALTERYNSALTNNPANADNIYREQLAPALVNAFMYTSNISCGNFDKAEEYYNKVLQFTGSQPDCACADSSTPTLITASGGGGTGTFVVDACGDNNAITVTPNTIGDTTTYTVCFNNTIFNKISALTETTVVSSDGTATITPSTSGSYNKQFDVSVNVPSIFSGIIDFDTSNNSIPPVVSFRANWSSVYGGKLQEPTVINTQLLISNFNKAPNCFYLTGYIAATGGEYPKPSMQVVEFLGARQTSVDCKDQRPFNVVITEIDTVNDRIYFKFVDLNGLPIAGYTILEKSDSISLSLTINA
jgi:hypothetical protein